VRASRRSTRVRAEHIRAGDGRRVAFGTPQNELVRGDERHRSQKRNREYLREGRRDVEGGSRTCVGNGVLGEHRRGWDDEHDAVRGGEAHDRLEGVEPSGADPTRDRDEQHCGDCHDEDRVDELGGHTYAWEVWSRVVAGGRCSTAAPASSRNGFETAAAKRSREKRAAKPLRAGA
jgi:hypothetical protein